MGFLLLVGSFYLTVRDDEQAYFEQLNAQFQAIDAQFDQDFVNLLLGSKPDESLRFSQLNFDTAYPFLVYSEEGKLAFWSDFTLVLDFNLVSVQSKYQLVEDNFGRYFTKLRRFSRGGQNYWLLQAVPIFYKRTIENQYLFTGPDSRLFGGQPIVIAASSRTGFQDLRAANGDYFFSVGFQDNASFLYLNEGNITLLIFFFSLIFLLLLIGYDFIRMLWSRGKGLLAIFYTATLLFSVRALMLFFHFPQDYFELDFFSAKFYASSFFNPSLGDLFLNVVFSIVVLLMIIGFITRKKFTYKIRRFLLPKPAWTYTLAAYLFSCVLLLLFYFLYLNIFQNAQWQLNILAIPSFDAFKLTSLVIIFIAGAGYLLFSILVMNLIMTHMGIGRRFALQVLLFFSIPTIGILLYLNWMLVLVFSAHLILVVSIITFRLYENVFTLGLNTFLTFFFGCLIGAVITGVATYEVQLASDKQTKVSFGQQQLVENDILAEYLLADVKERVAGDLFIKTVLPDPLQSNEAIVRKIKKIHIGGYFDQYEVTIRLFNVAGDDLLDADSPLRLLDYKKEYVNSDYATSIRDLYFIKNPEEDFGNTYVAFIPIIRDNQLLGTVLLYLKQMKVLPGAVFPRLLLDDKYSAGLNSRNFDYAVYSDEELLYSVGVFNYRAEDVLQLPSMRGLDSEGVNLKGYHHVGVGESGRFVVVSSPLYPIYYILADISFYFIAYILLTLLSILIYLTIRGMRRVDFNYSTKLQFYLNFAFFVPMLVISVIIIGLLTNSYREELNRQYFQRANLIGNNLSAILEREIAGELESDDFPEAVGDLSLLTSTEINIYEPSGSLLATSQPNIFDKGILRPWVNPRAIAQIVEGQNNIILLDEQVGELRYKAVYAAIRSTNNKEIRAIMAIPFFESENELDALIADVFSNILNIFVLIFIVFLIISYFVSKNLTYPFKMLTSKLSETDLDTNEPMQWPSRDEIGLLIDEYNNMLFKLEGSKKALASTEKESAWREMAKQVAHEIKNPLTPMKLTLQHLLRLQQMGHLDDPEKLKKPIQTLIHQVDTLSDIATSFSTFAKMPLPKNEQMDFRQVVIEAVELFKNREDLQLHFDDQLPAEEILILGDDQLFGRVIGNLIINGIQAVPEGRKPEIQLVLFAREGQVLLSIQDNGKGIPEELAEKIFVPNFSTKSEGSGLGLAIAKRGVETAGGRIWFESRVDEGSTFYLSFPLQQPV